MFTSCSISYYVSEIAVYINFKISAIKENDMSYNLLFEIKLSFSFTLFYFDISSFFCDELSVRRYHFIIPIRQYYFTIDNIVMA